MMKKRFLLLCFTLSIALTFTFSSCGPKSKDASASTTSTDSSSDSGSTRKKRLHSDSDMEDSLAAGSATPETTPSLEPEVTAKPTSEPSEQVSDPGVGPVIMGPDSGASSSSSDAGSAGNDVPASSGSETAVQAGSPTQQSFRDKLAQIDAVYYQEDRYNVSQQEMNQTSYSDFQMYDALLNEIYQHLKAVLPSSQFETLKQEERQWIKDKEVAVAAAGAEFTGGTMQPLAENSAAISWTRDRISVLIEMVP
ncbi:MAG: DUF1311 domain-containing protein [Clostridia bacterium]|nr:DUF1311 domain-containing protein [Clostridia bacterium]NCC42371.1 DUF1311 domain-containing protein [Clostridia bacterium]